MERNPPRAPLKRRPSDMLNADQGNAGAPRSSNISGATGTGYAASATAGHARSASSMAPVQRRASAAASRSSLHNVVIPPGSVASALSSAASSRTSVSGQHAGSTRASISRFSLPPPPPPPSIESSAPSYSIPTQYKPSTSPLSASALSVNSASAVSLSSRRSSSRQPRDDISALVDRLLFKICGAPTPRQTRRTMLQLTDEALSPAPSDPLTVLEKIKRRVQLDAPQYYEQPQHVISKLNEAYSRFAGQVPAKKGETLFLLYGLMDSTSPRIAPKQLRDDFSESEPMPMELDDEGVPSSTHSRQVTDSFKSSVGIASSKGPRSARTKTGSRSPAKTTRDSASAGNVGRMLASHNSFEVPEEILLGQVLYALQAIDSTYVYFDSAAERFQITRSVGVPTPVREVIHKLCELGWFYRKISQYLAHNRENLSYGVVGQSFCHKLNLELAEYFRLVTVLFAQVKDDIETRAPTRGTVSDLTLRQLLVWVHNPLERMRIMARLIDSVVGLRGGALASAIHSHVLHGDPELRQCVQNVMKAIAEPIFRMIQRWVFVGELNDSHGEFFIVANNTVSDDLLWSQKYHLNTSMLPSFIPIGLANKILVIGKSINFIRQCCGNTEWIMDARQNASVDTTVDFEDNGVRFAQLSSLERMIEQVSASTNEYLIRTLMQKYNMLDHCRALRRYMLLGQGDFIQYLMDLLRPELSKRASQVHRHTLMNVLETALNSSNAKFESADILARLDVELLRPSSGDSGWDIFSLHYKVPSPINTVMNDAAMQQYQRIFHFLWRLKRVEHSLSTSWNKDMHLDHMVKKEFHEVRPVIHKCQLLRSEMIQFTTTLHNYVMFEVLETSWHQLVRGLKSATNLDELISSHEHYIQSIKENGFMTESSKDLLDHLKVIFDTIIKFCRTQDNLYTAAIREVDEETARRKAIDTRTARGTWGIAEGDEFMEHARREKFGPSSLIFRQIDDIEKDFSSQVVSLLRMLQRLTTSTSSHTLSLLMVRFDFNEYYHSLMYPTVNQE